MANDGLPGEDQIIIMPPASTTSEPSSAEQLDLQAPPSQATWSAYLAKVPPTIALPFDRPPQAATSSARERCPVHVSDRADASLRALASQEAVSSEMVWLAALAAFLYRYTNDDALLVGAAPAEGAAGDVKLWPVHVRGHAGARQLVSHLRDVAAEVAELGPLSLAALGELRRDAATGERQPLFHAGLVWRDGRVAAEVAEALWSSTELSLVCDPRGATTAVELVYAATRFTAETIGRMAGHLARFLEEMAADTERPICELRLMDDAERRQIAVEWNATAAEVPRGRFFPGMVASVASRTPNAVALVCGDEVLTFATLNGKANQLAHHLRRCGVAQGSRIGVFLERGTQSVLAQLGVIKAGNAVLFLDPSQPEARIALLIQHAEAAAIVTREGLLDKLAGISCAQICVDRDAAKIAAAPVDDPEVELTDETPVLVAGTSGSTGEPKMVRCRHGALNNMIAWVRRDLGLTTSDRATWLSSPGYGISQMEWWSFLAAGAAVHVGADEVVGSPERLRDWLVQQHITHTFLMTPLALRLWRLEWPAEVALRVMQVGGERLREWPPERLPFEVLNVYGSAEATLVATCSLRAAATSRFAEERSWRAPPIGRPLMNVRTYILDEQQQPVPPGVVGELYVAGAGLSLGYTRRELTQEKFLASPLPEEPSPLVYRTGDLARYWPDGIIDICGRTDAQVKIRGSRVEPAEIERALAAQAGVVEVVVVDRESPSGERQLVAYVVPEPGAPPRVTDLRAALDRTLPRYMLPAAYVLLERLPRLQNGKLDRRGLPAPDPSRRDPSVPYVAPRGLFEETLASVWSQTLRHPQVGIDDGFFDLGGDSLLAMEVISVARRELGIEVPLSSFFAAPTVRVLARRVEEMAVKRLRGGTEASSPVALPALRHTPELRYEPFPLTDIQYALLVGRGDVVELGNVGCQGYFEWEGPALDLAALGGAWRRLITRHDMLRAIVRPDGLQQVLRDVPPYEISVIDLRERDPDDAEQELYRLREELSHGVLPADRWPLFDIRAVLLSGGRTRLILTFDLLIMDAWSYFQVVLPELVALYENPDAELPPLDITFRDYLTAMRDRMATSEEWRRSRDYWMQRLADLPAAPDLPKAPPHKRDAPLRFQARGHRLSTEEWSSLKARGQRSGVTSSVVLVAAFAEVLRAWSSNDRFTINFPIYDRAAVHPSVHQLVGDFTNTLLVAVEKTDGTFEERARSVQEQMWRDFDHRHFTGVQVIRELMRLHGSSLGAAMPIVVTSLLGQPSTHEVTAFGRQIFAVSQTPQVLLDFQIREVEGELRFNWDALDAMFPSGMLDDMFSAYCALLHRLAREEDTWHEQRFQLVPEAQLQQRRAINHTDAPVPEGLLHELIAARAREQPDAVAVITRQRRLSFFELVRRANQVGRHLRTLGVVPNELVAVVMEKGWEQYVAVYGVLTGGAAYLPIDPAVPAERLQYLLENGETRIVLTQSRLVERLSWPASAHVLCVDRDFELDDGSALPSVQQGTDLAYAIYTSGSTGNPKGVMVEHRGVVNMLTDINQRFGIGPRDRAFGISSLSFDASVYDVFGILAAGGAVVLPDPSDRPDPSQWVELIEKEHVTFWNSVPSLMEMLVEHLGVGADAPLSGLRLTVLSGDWIPLDLPRRLRVLAPRIQVMSSGGPTETIVWSVMFEVGDVDENGTSIPYGKPISNQRYHILDAQLEHRPIWAPGEMYVGSSVGLARGYWRNDELNRTRFLTLPDTGERIYATGDMGRYLPDGNIEILGRNDFQVKILGHRIELGEVEAALRQHAAVSDAVVLAPTRAGSKARRLVAFVVLRSVGACAVDDLRQYLEAKLPRHMIPASISLLEVLPRSRNGKTDRKALAQLAVEAPQASEEAPRSPIEKVVTALCASVLEVEHVGPHDDFFTLGGDSLLAVRFVGQLRELLEVNLPIRSLFTGASVSQICEILTTDPSRRERVLATAEILAELSEGDVDHLLSEALAQPAFATVG